VTADSFSPRKQDVLGVGISMTNDADVAKTLCELAREPRSIQRKGLEWLFRLTSEPLRRWRRYVLVTPWFLPCWALQSLSLSMSDLACGRASLKHNKVNA
jgi:UDP-N-acetyl-D-mannosaminuronic acid transferase (WecB/TagA/CpsF family)